MEEDEDKSGGKNMPLIQLAAYSTTVNGHGKKGMHRKGPAILQCQNCHLVQCPLIKLSRKDGKVIFTQNDVLRQCPQTIYHWVTKTEKSFKANIRANRDYLRMSGAITERLTEFHETQQPKNKLTNTWHKLITIKILCKILC